MNKILRFLQRTLASLKPAAPKDVFPDYKDRREAKSQQLRYDPEHQKEQILAATRLGFSEEERRRFLYLIDAGYIDNAWKDVRKRKEELLEGRPRHTLGC